MVFVWNDHHNKHCFTIHSCLTDSSGFVSVASCATSVRRYLPACRPATVCVQTSARCPQRLDPSDICEVTVTVLMLQPDAENNISVEPSQNVRGDTEGKILLMHLAFC